MDSKQKICVALRMAWLITLLLACTAVSSIAQQNTIPSEASRYFQRGNGFVAKNLFERARAEYEKALKVFPKHLDALYNLGVVCERLSLTNEAVGHYETYLKYSPKDPDVWTQLGVLFDQQGNISEAQLAYERALEANPEFGRAHHNLGVLLKKKNDFVGAEKHLVKYVQLSEESPAQAADAYYSLGILYLERLSAAKAKSALQRAIDIDPSIARYHNAMGDVYLLKDNPNLAIASYRSALEHDSNYALAYSGLGDAYLNLKRIDKAVEAYQRALNIQPGYGLIHYKLGLAFRDTNPTEAMKHLESYLESGKNLAYREQVTSELATLKNTQNKNKQ